MVESKKGFTLIEVLVAMAILSIVSVAFLSALTNSSKAAASIDSMDTGRVIAQSQMEYVKQQTFQSSGTYTANSDLMTEYPGYSVLIPQATEAPQRDVFIQKITVIVSHAGKEVARLEDCKVKR